MREVDITSLPAYRTVGDANVWIDGREAVVACRASQLLLAFDNDRAASHTDFGIGIGTRIQERALAGIGLPDAPDEDVAASVGRA